jgi:hypothetical protein
MGELVIQVGCSVGNNTDCEIKTGDGFRGDIIGGRRKGPCSGYGVGGAKLATVKEKEEARSIVSLFSTTRYLRKETLFGFASCPRVRLTMYKWRNTRRNLPNEKSA